MAWLLALQRRLQASGQTNFRRAHDDIDHTIMIGYSGEVYNSMAKEGQEWTKCTWKGARSLKVGDRVGIQVAKDGHYFLVHNEEIVLTGHGSEAFIEIVQSKPLFGMVELLGNTDAVVLLD